MICSLDKWARDAGPSRIPTDQKEGGMNILHVTRIAGMGGAEKVIRQVCGATRRQFERIILCAADGGGFSAFDGYIDRYYEIPDMQYKDPHTFFKIFFQLRDILKKERIDIIHVHHRMAALYVRILNIYFHKTIIYTGHGTHGDKRILTRFSLHGFHIITVGDKVKRNLKDFYKVKAADITVINNTVEGFDGIIYKDPRLACMKREGNILVGNIARLSKEKGQKYFIMAAEAVLGKYKNVKFLIIGDGNDRNYLENLVREKGISNHVFFLGFRDDVRNLILQMDILVLSSLREGLPLTPIEAFSVGKAIIASNIDGTNEVIEDGVNGLLYEPYMANELAERICDMIGNPRKWEKMCKNAMRSYKDRFSYEAFCEKYRDYYNRFCDMDRDS